jgi:ABC-type transport system involved in cytochrome c biogenesis permease subunit
MIVSMESTLAIGGTAIYGLSSVIAVAALVRTRERQERPALTLLACGALLLLAMLAFRMVRAGGIPVFTRFDALAAYTLALSGAYLLLITFRYTRGMAAVLTPYLTLVLLSGIPTLRMEDGALAPVQGLWLALHVLTAYAAFGVFTLASLCAAVYLMQDGNLKHKRFGVVWERLPSLEMLDHLMSRLAGIAFLLLTVSIILGFALVRQSGGGEIWYTDPKVAATVATWILLAVFVHLRASSDRHGRGIALMAVAGLVCLFFTFMGVHLVADTVHSFLNVGLGMGGP